MPIYRLSAVEIRGFVVNDDAETAAAMIDQRPPDFLKLVERTIREYRLTPQVCTPGSMDITPPYWSKYKAARHMLEVLAGGEEAMHHFIPEETTNPEMPDVLSDYMAQEVGVSMSRTTTRIPGESRIVFVVGSVPEDARPRIHEIVTYSPPLSP